MCSAPWYAASSPPRSASTAGANDCGADHLLDDRVQPAGAHLEERRPRAIEAATEARSNGSRSGSSARIDRRFVGVDRAAQGCGAGGEFVGGAGHDGRCFAHLRVVERPERVTS